MELNFKQLLNKSTKLKKQNEININVLGYEETTIPYLCIKRKV